MEGDIPKDANEHCPGTSSEQAGKASACEGCPNKAICATAPKGPDPDVAAVAERLKTVKHTVLVLSGKGGVGKSTFSSQLAFALAASGKEVGLLDVDICGPSIPRMLGLEGEEIHQSGAGWSPVYVEDNLGVMSIGFMLPNKDDAVVWRGPRKNGLIKQFLKDTDWGCLDYLVVDTPPGTSDEHISLVQYLKDVGVDGALVVTTPQEVACADVRKEVNFCKKVGLRCLGVVENMSSLVQPLDHFKFIRQGEAGMEKDITAAVVAAIQQVAPDLSKVITTTEVFPRTGGGGEAVAHTMGVPFLGRVPLDPNLSRAAEEGVSGFDSANKMLCAGALQHILQQVIAATEGGEAAMDTDT